MNKLYDVLEICLQELENGADMESVLARYPDLARELRPILNGSVNARMRSAAMPAPSSAMLRRGRSKLLQRASEMREAGAVSRRRVIPFFQRLAISFTLTALFLASGTGLVGASSSALPGENLYPIKLTLENLRLFFTFDHETRELLENSFENERLHEINELLATGRYATIKFAGIFMKINEQTFVAGIRIAILDTTVLPAGELLNGAAVIVTGRTNADGFVDAESIELLPDGTVVPAGLPSETEKQHNGNQGGNNNVNINENENADNNNVNGNNNSNGDDNINSNNSNDSNDNGSQNGNANNNDSVNDNGNVNSNDDNENVNSNSNENENVNENNNENVNENVNENGNENVNENSNEDINENVNENGNDNEPENDSENSNDGNDNDNDNDNGVSESIDALEKKYSEISVILLRWQFFTETRVGLAV